MLDYGDVPGIRRSLRSVTRSRRLEPRTCGYIRASNARLPGPAQQTGIALLQLRGIESGCQVIAFMGAEHDVKLVDQPFPEPAVEALEE